MPDDKVLQLADLVAERRKQGGREPPAESRGLPIVRWREGQLARIVDEVNAALSARALEVNIYRSGSRLVQVAWQPVPVSDGNKEDMPQMVDIAVPGMLYRISQVCKFEKWSKTDKDWVPSSCPALVAEAYLALPGTWMVPVLFSVITAPTIRWDGSILSEPGYDERTCILYQPTEEFPDIPTVPTFEECKAALVVLRSIIASFPFVDRVDESIALAAIMTTVVRTAIPHAPVFCIDAPTARTGKSLFIDVASVVGAGHCAAVTSQGKSDRPGTTEAELEKRLGAKLLSGATVISIDNVNGEIESDFLCQMLTQTIVSVRILGLSKEVNCTSSATVFINGNNVVVVGDLTQRSVQNRMDAMMDNPEERRFDSHVLNEARRRRAELVVAVLTIIRGCVLHGGEGWRVITPFGGFEGWTRMVRYPLTWLGEVDPISSMKERKAEDPKLVQLQAVMQNWLSKFGVDEIKSINEIIGIATERDLGNEHGEGGGYLNGDMLAALRSVAGGREGISDVRLGLWMRRNMGRTVTLDGTSYRIVKEQTRKGAASEWSIREVRKKDDELPF